MTVWALVPARRLGGTRREGRRVTKKLLGRPQLLALAVALVIAVPVLVIGQASEDETRARLRASQLDSATRAADVVSANFADRLERIRGTLVALALGRNPDESPVGLATQRGDVAALQAIADAVQRLYPRYVVRTYIATRGQAETIYGGTIVAASPAGTGLVGQRLPDVAGESGAVMRRSVATLSTFDTGTLSEVIAGAPAAPTEVVIMATAIPRQAFTDPNRSGGSLSVASLAVIVAEIDYARTFADTVAMSLAQGDDAYVLDEQRRLIGRARDVFVPMLDLSADPFVQLLGPATTAVARWGATDPLGAGTRLIASAPLAGNNGAQAASVAGQSYSVLLVRDTSALDREVDAALGQLALFRLVVVAMLLVLAYVVGLAASQLTLRAVDQERLRLARDLHDLLGHSLSLITIKSELARRLLPSTGASAAEKEIVDVQRVARESLADVRHAVDGYRQPTFRSAIVGAKAALAAAKIDSTIEDDAGRLPAVLDATLAWAVREGVTNVIRHSHAGRCSIRLTRDGREARLEIIDDGPLTAMATPGNGLHGLKERAAACGGHADAGPLAQGGFRLSVSLPVTS